MIRLFIQHFFSFCKVEWVLDVAFEREYKTEDEDRGHSHFYLSQGKTPRTGKSENVL